MINTRDITHELPRPPSSDRERASDATRVQLFEAAIAEFRRTGFEQASVARIAREAGVSRPTFYFHFPSKGHVLLEMSYALQAEIAEQLKRCRSLGEALSRLIDGLIGAEEAVGDSALFIEMLTSEAKKPERTIGEARSRFITVELTRHFRESAERGELRPGIDVERAPLLCLASVFGVFLGVPKDDRRADFEHLFSLYLAEGAV